MCVVWNVRIIPTAENEWRGTLLQKSEGEVYYCIINVIAFAIFMVWPESDLKMSQHVKLLDIFIVAFKI